MNEINKAHNLNFLDNSIPDKSIQLLICDSPYYKVKGEFDFIWKTFDDYLQDVEKWAIECKRILADNGTLFWYGDAKNIAYAQVIFDKHFCMINNITWEVFDRQTNKGIDQFRCFAPVTERILMYSNKSEPNKNVFQAVMDYIKNERLKCGWNYSQMDNFLNIKASSCFWDKETSHEYVIPTLEHWNKLQKTGNFHKEYEELRKEYEELRKEYEELRRPFDNTHRLTDVMRFSQEGHITGKYDHDTVKPLKLSRVLIQTCSRKGDLVCIPFAGSGTECEASIIESRKFVAFDIEKKYVDMTNKRVKPHLQQQTIFDLGA